MSEELADLKVRVGDIHKSLTEVKTIISMRDTKAEELAKKVDEIYDFLIGSTDAFKPSINMRMDRLEQIHESTKWIWMAVGGLVINAAWAWLKGK